MSLLVQPPPSSCKHTSTLLPLLQHRPAVSPAGLSWWTYGRGEVERSGVGGSTAEQMQKKPSWVCWGQALSQPPCSRAAAQAPAVPGHRTKRPRHFLTVLVGGEPRGGGAVQSHCNKSRWHSANTPQPLSLPLTTPDKTCLEMHSSPFHLWPLPYTQWARWLHSTYTMAVIHLHLYGTNYCTDPH